MDEKMQVLDKAGKVVPNLYCIGDANGKYMLAHAASAQGISAVENMVGRSHVLNHLSVPAACFTHPEVSLVYPLASCRSFTPQCNFRGLSSGRNVCNDSIG